MSSGLGDLEALRTLSIEPGSVFRMKFLPSDGVVPKDEDDDSRNKYFIIIGKDHEGNYIALTLINTDINLKLFNIIGPYQHKIFAAEYEFLKGKDRYIDCYRIKEVSAERLLAEGIYIGYVSPELLIDVKMLAVSSPTMAPATVTNYSLA